MGLEVLAADLLAQDPDERMQRKERAQHALTLSIRERALALHLLLFTVVFTGDKEGRQMVAVRDKPSRQARIVGTRKRGDELLVAEERDGWVRISEEDDEWASQLAHRRPTDEDGGSVRLEAWLLIDGAEVGFGMLLARVPL